MSGKQPPKKDRRQFRIEDDGITHVNVYSRGKTELGRSLSNFSKIGFTHPKYGTFASMEGFWYYVKTGFQYEGLRNLSGITAKMVGRKLEVVRMDTEEFEDIIRSGLTCKVEQNPDLLDMLVANTLPLTHYYVMQYGDYPPVQVESPEHQWQLDHLNSIRMKWCQQ